MQVDVCILEEAPLEKQLQQVQPQQRLNRASTP